MNIPKRFVIVDDDLQNNFLSKIALKKAFGEIEIVDFSIPELGLNYIETHFADTTGGAPTTLLLDINMPDINGWEFLEKFDTFKDTIKNQFTIYMLSSTIDASEIDRAKLNPLVKDFIEKPLNKNTLLKFFG